MGGLCISSCWNSRRRRSNYSILLLLGAAHRVMHYREGNARGQGLSRVNMRAKVVKWNNHVFRGSSQPCSQKHVLSEGTREKTKDTQIFISGNLFGQCITRCSE